MPFTWFTRRWRFFTSSLTWMSLNMDITEINTLNQEGVENLQATLRACGELETQAGRLRTRDPDLGKVVLYQLSYSRNGVP